MQPWQNYQAGADESTIIARLGPPREVYDLPNGGKRLMWPTQPLGEITTAADIDASGKIVNVRQVLDANEFYKAEIGTWTKKDVLVNFGRPVETSYFPLMKREVWTYRYHGSQRLVHDVQLLFRRSGHPAAHAEDARSAARSGSAQHVLKRSLESDSGNDLTKSRLPRRHFFIQYA